MNSGATAGASAGGVWSSCRAKPSAVVFLNRKPIDFASDRTVLINRARPTTAQWLAFRTASASARSADRWKMGYSSEASAAARRASRSASFRSLFRSFALIALSLRVLATSGSYPSARSSRVTHGRPGRRRRRGRPRGRRGSACGGGRGAGYGLPRPATPLGYEPVLGVSVQRPVWSAGHLIPSRATRLPGPAPQSSASRRSPRSAPPTVSAARHGTARGALGDRGRPTLRAPGDLGRAAPADPTEVPPRMGCDGGLRSRPARIARRSATEVGPRSERPGTSVARRARRRPAAPRSSRAPLACTSGRASGSLGHGLLVRARLR